ncbi:MAG: hypothetical protein GEV10_18855 [Streptosporangiales bacterium]|nr:hypothetical protein [Streptosporangiales bacterium]
MAGRSVRVDARARRCMAWCVTVVLCASLAACGGEGDGDTGQGDSSITIALSTFGNEQLDPAMESRSQVLQLLLPMFDTILEIGTDGAVEPGLAESWKASEDGLSWTFKLRKGVQFHGGYGELTAEDVKFSLERWANPNGGNSESGTVAGAIDRVEVVDDYTFVIRTKGVRTDLPYLLAPHQSAVGIVFSKKYLTEAAGDDFEAQAKAMNEKPIGSGPFQFVSHTRGSSVTMKAVTKHWRRTPKVRQVEFLLVPEVSTQVSMLKSGDADIIEVSGDQADEVEAAGGGLEVRSIPDALGVGFHVPGIYRPGAKDRKTQDVRVRQAMSLAIDRKAILQTLLGGRGDLPTTPWNTTEATADIDVEHFKSKYAETMAYDPGEAKRLLAEAGYPDGVDGITLDAFNRPGAANLPQLAEIIAAQWAKVGIDAKIRTQDYGNYRAHWSPGGPVSDLLDDDYNAGWPVVYSSTPRFEAYGAAITYLNYEEGPIGLLRDAELDEKISTINATTDEEKRRALATEIFDTADDAWVMVPLFNADFTYGVDTETVGEWTTYPGWAFFGRILETVE